MTTYESRSGTSYCSVVATRATYRLLPDQHPTALTAEAEIEQAQPSVES